MNSCEEITVRQNGSELYGYFIDRKSKNNLVLVPGSHTHHSIWFPVVEKAKINANLMLVELPGFGKSMPREPDGTIEGFTAQILKLIDAAGLNRFFVGGHSIGGMIAIEMTGHASNRIDGVISIEGWTHFSVSQEAFNGLKNETLTAKQMARRLHYGSMGQTAWSEEEIRMYCRIWRKWNRGKVLLDVATMPILEIWGDRALSPRPGRELLQIPDRDNIELVWIENGGHSLTVQFPERIGSLIEDFVRIKGTGWKDMV